MRRTSNQHGNKFATALVAGLALLAVGELTGTSPLLLGGDDARAVIGRPLTPMSYAGVARRTTRRAAYYGAAPGAYAGYYVPPAVATAAVVTTLPAGCARVASGGAIYYDCGTVRYQPAYHGATVVYRPI